MMNNTKSYLAERLEKERETETAKVSDSFQGSYLAQAMKNHNVPTSDVIKANNQFVNTITGIQNEYAETYGQSALKDYQATKRIEADVRSKPEYNTLSGATINNFRNNNDYLLGAYDRAHSSDTNFLEKFFIGGDAMGELGGFGEMLVTNYIGFLTDEERKVYNYLYSNGQKQLANEYLGALRYTLETREYQQKHEQQINDIAQKGNSFVGGLQNIGPGQANAIAYGGLNVLQSLSNAITGADYKINPYGYTGRGMLVNQAHNQAAKRDATPLGEWLVDTGISIGQNVMLSPLYAVPGGQTIALGILASSAAGNVMYQKIQEGASTQEAANYGIAAGIIEALTERISWKSLDNIIKGAAKSGVKGSAKEIFSKIGMALAVQGGTEGAEEGISALGNLAFDEAYSAIVKGEGGEVSDYYNELINSGKSADEAILETFGKFGADVLLAVAGGFLSGGIMGSGGTVIGSITNKWRNASNDKNKPSDTTTSKEKLDEMVAGGEITQ